MNNFIFQNHTKVYFGRGCVKEYLACLTKKAGTILLAYGGGSIKANGVYDEISGILHTAGKTVVEFAGISPMHPIPRFRRARSWPDNTRWI